MKNSLVSKMFIGAMFMAPMTISATSSDNSKLYFPMTISNGQITESVSGAKVNIEGQFAPMSIKGIDGDAWRTDGYTSWATANLGEVLNSNKMTSTLRIAIDTYPIIHHEQPTDEQIPIVTCLDEGAKTGYGYYLGRTGKYSFRAYIGGQLVEVNANGILPLWEWDTLSATYDGSTVKLYKNGELVGQAAASGNMVVKGEFHIAWDRRGDEAFGARLGGFNGAIDHIRLTGSVDPVSDYVGSYANLNFSKDKRYGNDIMRPRFHGMPMQNWTNETHGLIKYNGKYHVFYQKTGSAPIMSHQHWGHLVSTDLINWTDDTPVLAPGENYDIKGCWSGCVFTDPDINGGKPTILYTGVNYAEPYAAIAYSKDDNLRTWEKDTRNPYATIEQTNNSHFRDTYFFTQGGQKYFIIGGSKDGKAACHLYKYDNGNWVNDGYFYESPDRGTDGEFAEMPNVVQFGDRWIMTTTPLGSSRGVTCNYRTGRIENGRFIPDAGFQNPKQVDVLAEKGFGLMSPSPYKDENGKVIALGIVADKLPTHYNLEHGYAHLYSLPREWSLDENGDLLQKPYSGLSELRAAEEDRQLHIDEPMTLEGAMNLSPVRGREVEVEATFEVGDAAFGFEIYKDVEGKTAKVTYNPANHELSVDFGSVARYNQDEGNPNRFSAILEKVPAKGEEMKLHLFVDHSIMDIFVNDRYASSVRIFPTDSDASVVEVFSDGETTLVSLDAYIMNDRPEDDPDIIVPEDPEVPETTGKVAMWVAYPDNAALQAGSDDEKAAVEFFTNEFPDGEILYANDIDKVQAGDFDCIWIHIDRLGIAQGWTNLPAPFNQQATYDRLNAYLADGGNLYLSTHATQLVEAMGRTNHGVNIYSAGEGGVGNDAWQVNITPFNESNLTHPIFHGLPTIDAGYGTVINLLENGAGLHREDHNCMWDLNRCNGHDSFCTNHNARVLGTWGHSGGQLSAGIVEFLPAKNDAKRAISKDRIEKRKGTIIANGLAACEWSCRNNGVNLHQANLEGLTRNVLSYLSPKEEEENLGTGISQINVENPTATPVYFSLQGIRVANPKAGEIYIRVVGNQSEKIVMK